MTDDEMRATMQAFQTEMMEKQKKASSAAGEINKKLGDEFLAKNKTKGRRRDPAQRIAV